MHVCAKCGRPVSHDEIGLSRKLINRAATAFFCYDCLSDYFKVSVEKLKEAAAHFRAMGCTLF